MEKDGYLSGTVGAIRAAVSGIAIMSLHRNNVFFVAKTLLEAGEFPVTLASSMRSADEMTTSHDVW